MERVVVFIFGNQEVEHDSLSQYYGRLRGKDMPNCRVNLLPFKPEV
jgi:hypothetical protein